MVKTPWIKTEEAKTRRRIRAKVISLKHSSGYAQKADEPYASWKGRANTECKRCVSLAKLIQYN